MEILSVILIYFTLQVLKLFIHSIQEISSLRMAIIKNNTNNERRQGRGEKGSSHPASGNLSSCSHCRHFLKRPKSELPLGSAVPQKYRCSSNPWFKDSKGNKELTGSCCCVIAKSSVHEIPQVRILEQVAIPFSRGPSQPQVWTHGSYTAGGFTTESPGSAII